MQLLLFMAALSSTALADEVLALAPRYLYVRQNQAFTPPTTIESGCRSNEIQCPGTFNGLPTCVTPTLGDVCCAGGYGCPGGSFCLINGLCCPDGVDPKTCATRQGITLPNDFTAGSTVAYSASTPATSSSQTPPATSVIDAPTFTTEATSLSQTPPSTSVIDAPTFTTEATSSFQTPPSTSVMDVPTFTSEATSVTSSSSTTVAVRTTTSTPPQTTPPNASTSASTTIGTNAGSTSAIPFTGGASALSFGRSDLVAAFVGVVGLLW